MSSTAPSLDPAALAAFRQQGGAIVAQERGLTPACRIKLAGLARSLGIAEEQIEIAIGALRETEPAAPPNPAAEKFRKRLTKDLGGKTRSIIGPTIEAQIVEAAARKYGLSDEAAREVIAQVAGELGLMRITASDAVHGLGAQIDEVVGDGTWLAREGWDRLRNAGGKWGIELDVVDELIEEKLAANRESIRRERFWKQAVVGGAVSAAALAAVVIVVLLVIRGGTNSEPSPESSTAAAVPPEGELERSVGLASPGQPAWWDVDLAIEMAAAKTKFAGLGGASELMAAPAADERAAGYEKLINQVRAAVPAKLELLTAVERIFSGAHALEPDEAAAARLRGSLLALLPTPDAPLPTRSEQYDVVFWAAETAASAMHHKSAGPERREALAGAMSASLAAPFDPAADVKSHQALAQSRAVWLAFQQLSAAANKHPKSVAALYRPLAERAALLLTDEELGRAESSLLAAALPAAGDQWDAYEAGIVRCASSPEALPVLKLADTLAKCEDPDLVRTLSQLLLLRVKVTPKSTAKDDVVSAVRKALGASGATAGSSAADRWEVLRGRADAALARSAPAKDDTFAALQQTVELAHLTTLAIALAQGEAGFASFDAGMTEPPELKRDGDSEGRARGGSAPRGVPRTPLRESRELERYAAMLGGYARHTPPQRLNALRGLVTLADAAADLSPADADSVARYLVAEKSAEEHQAIVAALGGIRKWKRLRLAVADRWGESQLSVEQAPGLVSVLLGRVLPQEMATPENVRRFLMESVLRDLAESTTAGPAHGDVAAGEVEAAASVLTEIYRERAKLLGVGTAEYQAASSPAQALSLSLMPVASTLRGSAADEAYLAAFGHLHKAARFLAGDDLRQTVANQRLLIELSSRRVARLRSQHAAAARQLDAESLAAIGAAPSVLDQLRQQEATLLQLWMLYGPEA
jgi:hypothetical protein